MISIGRIRQLALPVILLGAACDAGPAEPPAEFPFASATPECGPADGPAIAIYLTRDTMPALPPGGARIRVYLWHSLGELRGESWLVGGASQDGFADHWDGAGTTTPLTGTVSVITVKPDSTVEGEVDLEDGTMVVRGGFRARWIPRTPLCG